jgi:hypothetical protein
MSVSRIIRLEMIKWRDVFHESPSDREHIWVLTKAICAGAQV